MTATLTAARDITTAIRDGDITAEAVTTACLERIVAEEASLRAWAYIDPDRALAQARACDARPATGPLHGVPVGIKDIFDTADLPTSYGSPIYAQHQPDRDAEAVRRLRRAGAVILGKTVTTEFALFNPGPTTNPHDPTRTPGGSSSGSAAAVAAGMVPLALGTQTAGSVIRPASYCGVFGAKPTYGRIPTDGIKPCAPSFDTVGVFARNVDDLALAYDALLGDDESHGAKPPELTVGWVAGPHWDQIDPASAQILEAAVAVVGSRYRVMPLTLPQDFAELTAAHATMMAVEVNRALAHERREHPSLLSPTLVDFLIDADAAADAYAAAQQLAARCRTQLPRLFDDVDVILTPSVLGEPPTRETTGDPLLCRMWTLLGVPAVAIPGLVGPHGLPLGMQVVAPIGNDRRALHAAAVIAAAVAEG